MTKHYLPYRAYLFSQRALQSSKGTQQSPKGALIPRTELNNSLEGLFFPHMGLIKLKNLCLHKHRSNSIGAELCIDRQLESIYSKAIYSARLTRPSKAVTYLANTFEENHDKLKKKKKAHSRTSLSNVHSKTQKLRTETKRKFPSLAKRGLPSSPRDR